jgi:hypothetical protein
MFRIGAAQMAALDGVAAVDLVERIAKFLRVEMPDEIAELSESELRRFIAQAHVKAQTHRIQSDAAIAQYVCLALDAGTDFADQPDIAEFLRDADSDPEEQLDYLVDLLADKEELEALLPAAIDEGDNELYQELRAAIGEREKDDS